MARFAYPEYTADIRQAFDGIASANGLEFKPIGNMAGYSNTHLTLYFGIEMGKPEPYLKVGQHPLLTGDALLNAAGLPMIASPARVNSDRELTQALLRGWAQALAPLLPALAHGDTSRLNLPSPEQAEFEQRLRTYIYNHAPITHIARTRLWEADWRVHAEAFLVETGKTME